MRVRCCRDRATRGNVTAVRCRLHATRHQRKASDAYVGEIRTNSQARGESTRNHYSGTVMCHATEHCQQLCCCISVASGSKVID